MSLKEVVELHPEMEVEFSIDIIPGTDPIYVHHIDGPN